MSKIEHADYIPERKIKRIETPKVTTAVQDKWPPKVTAFLGVDGKDKQDSNAQTLLKSMKSGFGVKWDLDSKKWVGEKEGWKKAIEKVRSIKDKDARNAEKAKLWAVKFQGTFTKLGDQGLKAYSGLVVIDLDHLANLLEIKEKLFASKNIVSVFTSPSGDGLKVLIDARGYNGQTYKIAEAKAIKLIFDLTGILADADAKGVSRFCFISYDPDLLQKWDTTPIEAPKAEEIKALEETKRQRPIADSKTAEVTTPYGRKALESECEKASEAQDGTRHQTLNTSAFVVGTLVGGGEIAYDDAVDSLEEAGTACGLPMYEVRATVSRAVLEGMESPRNADSKSDELDNLALELAETCKAEGNDWLVSNGTEETTKTTDATETKFVVSPNGKDALAEKKSKKKKFSLMEATKTGEDLNKTTPKPHDWIVEDWLPVGLSKLVANEKAGKTWIAMQMAMSICNGNPFMDRFAIRRRGKVLYLGLEQSEEMNHSRFNDILQGKPLPPNIRIFSSGEHSFPLLNEGGLEELGKYIESENPSAIFIDVYQAVASVPNSKMNAYQADSQALRPLQQLANQHKIAIMILHHTRKGTVGSRDPSETTSGSRAMDSIPEHNLFLQREYDADDAIVKTKTRVGAGMEDMAIKWHPDSHLFSFVGSGKEQAMNIQRAQILGILENAKDEDSAMTIKDIMESLAEAGTEKGYHAVKNQLARMFEAGLVKRTGAGGRSHYMKYYGAVEPEIVKGIEEAEAIDWSTDEENKDLF